MQSIKKKPSAKILLILASVLVLFVCGALSVTAAVGESEALGGSSTRPYKITDVTHIQRVLASFEDESKEDIQKYDFNRNGKLDINDATILQQILAEFPSIYDVDDYTVPSVTEPTEEPSTAPPVHYPTYLTFEERNVEIGLNETYQIVYSTDAHYVSFEVENSEIADVTENGQIIPKAIGSTKVFGVADGLFSEEFNLSVKSEAKEVTLNAQMLKMGIGEQYTLKASIPTGTAAKYREFTSGNSNIAAVDAQKGIITAKSTGTTKIYCTLKNGAQAVCEVNVYPAATSLSFNVSKLTLSVGETFDVDSYVPSGTAAYYRSYYSGNTEVAVVAKSGGIITAKAEGTVVITCNTQHATGTIELVVTAKPTTVILNTNDSKEMVGKDYYLYASTDAGSDSNRIFTYSSSNPSIVQIKRYKNNASTLTPKSQGTAYITVKTTNGKEAVCKVTVSGTTVKCIDISTWQGDYVDFEKVKASGISHVIIRAGYGTKKDNRFEANYAKAKAAGMKVGVYWFSYSTTVYGGVEEANACLKYLNGKKLDMPIYYDLEYDPALQTLGYSNYRQMTYNFCNTILKAGYKTGVYASASDYTSYFSPTDFYNRGYSVWNAHWASSTPVTCDIWQYSEKGRVNGISTDVDMNYLYNLNIVN